MGERGPAPKRSSQRRRQNKPEHPITESARRQVCEPPKPADTAWHPVAQQWYESLGQSGQCVYYTASDWALAYMLAESISRDLKPRFVGISGETGEAIIQQMPIGGTSLTAYLKGMTDLLVSEAARRRAGVELQAGQDDQLEDDTVATLESIRGGKAG
ncbi:hypothetical protein [Sciscionella sediminilitoris]|uniref:phage terminase small subunit n=1 Tax=Sciscionella sediminilitoris TaxID=1445613 RepID=UPI0012E20935|nr:hypothetical protein [Sciscionella sp. SE31]